uniref:Uncharacterized protein n=1 Tax=Panagrolaimus davidi TaxID=227884 RepID=A0A914PSZ4_9BILA
MLCPRAIVLTVDVPTALLQPQQQHQPYSPLPSQWPSSQQQPAFVTQSTQQATQTSSVQHLLPPIRPLPPSQQPPSSSSLAASQHSPPNTPLSWRSFPSPSNLLSEPPLSSQVIWNWSSQSAAATSSHSTPNTFSPPPPLSWRSFPSPSNLLSEPPLSSQVIWNWSSQSAAATSSHSTPNASASSSQEEQL